MKAFIKDVPFGISVIFIILAIGFVYIAAPIFGNSALIVRSGSMQPQIAVGDLAVVKKQADGNYKAGDIIAFKNANNSKTLTTHRIAGIKNQNGKVFYQTKGDANKTVDRELVSAENVVGKAYFRLPYLGKLIAFTKTSTGFALAVIFPALLVIAFEIQNIFKEIKKQKSVRPEAPKQPAYPVVMPIVEVWGLSKFSDNKLRFKFPSLKVLLPILASALLVYNSFAFFSDTETSTGNIFTAADSFGPPIANHIVINEVYYDPDSSHIQPSTADENGFEWIELFNPTSGIVNLKNWKIIDNSGTERSISESNRDLGPGEFVMIAKAANVRTQWGVDSSKFIAIGQIFGNGLANTNDRVILKDELGNVVDQMSYGTDTTAYNPASPDVDEGHSLERNPAGVDTDTAVDFEDRNPPTPGS